MEITTKNECRKDFHICPECGAYVEEHCFVLECDHCLSKQVE